MMLLLVLRCRNTILRAQSTAKNSYDEEINEVFNAQITNLDERVKLKCDYVDELLKASGNKFRSILKEKMSKLINK